jgi:hypothetical protein
MFFTANPVEHQAWQIERKGEGLMQMLRETCNDLSIGRLAKREKKEIAKHYREEFKRMGALRLEGVEGWLDFENWI